MYTNTLKLLSAAAVIGGGFFLSPAPASADCGFIACVFNSIYPGSGPILDGMHDALGRPLSTPPGRPAPAPAPASASPPTGNFCATPQGVFGPTQFNVPVGAQCGALVAGGVVYGNVILIQ